MPALYALLFAGADTCNSIVNRTTHTTLPRQLTQQPLCMLFKLTRFRHYAQFKMHAKNGCWWRQLGFISPPAVSSLLSAFTWCIGTAQDGIWFSLAVALVAIVSIVCVVSIFLHDPYRRLSPFFGNYKGCGDQDVQCIATELHLLGELLAFLPTHMFGYDLLSAGNGSLNIANIPVWRISHSTIF